MTPRAKFGLIAIAFMGALLYPIMQLVGFLGPISVMLSVVSVLAFVEIAGLPYYKLLNWVAPRLGVKRNSSNDYMFFGLMYRIIRAGLPRLRYILTRARTRLLRPRRFQAVSQSVFISEKFCNRSGKSI